MTEVTADSNIYISALVFGGLPLTFLNFARAGRFRLAISDWLLDEVRRVLRDKFRWKDAKLAEWLEQLTRIAVCVHPTQALHVVVSDPDDNHVLECAVAAGSRFIVFIVTGDNDLLRLGRHDTIQIVKAAEFLKLMQLSET